MHRAVKTRFLNRIGDFTDYFWQKPGFFDLRTRHQKPGFLTALAISPTIFGRNRVFLA